MPASFLDVTTVTTIPRKKNKTAAEIAERRKAIERENAEKKRIEEEQEYRELLARQTYETWLEIKVCYFLCRYIG